MLAISYLYPYNSIILGVEVKSELNEYTYMIDNRDNICEVSENWNSFAVKNDAPELTAEKVAGESIWNFLKKKDVRHIYHNLICLSCLLISNMILAKICLIEFQQLL